MSLAELELREQCDQSIKLFNAGDYESVAELYTPHTQFLAPDFSRINSKEGVRKFWKSTFKAGYRFEKIDTIEIRIDKLLAYWLFEWEMSSPNEEDSKLKLTGKNVLIWENTADGWLICLDSWNSPA